MVAMPSSKQRSCSHVTSISVPEDLLKSKRQLTCNTCPKDGHKGNNWLCLHINCSYVGCGENQGKGADHSGHHYKVTGHCVALNLRNSRMWCYKCLYEVHHAAVTPGTSMKEHQKSEVETKRPARSESSSILERGKDVDVEVGSDLLPQGLTGLRNLGNTCYMNAALQSLSNCPQLTTFLLKCGPASYNIERNGLGVSLSESFTNLIRKLWIESRVGMVSPTELTSAVKAALPTFRGYIQQDSQEFLRCFMDRLHEEMKEPVSRGRRDRDSDELVRDGESCGEESPEGDDDDSEEFESEDEEREEEEASRSDVPFEGEAEDDDVGEGGHGPREAAGDNPEGETAPAPDSTTVDAEDGLAHNPAGDHPTEPAPGARTAMKRRSPSCSGTASPLAKPPKRKKVTHYRSIISDIFDGKLLSSVQCRTCERISSRKETFQDLSLPIPSREHVAVMQSRSGNVQAGLGAAASSRACNELTPTSNNSWLQWLLGLVYSIFSVFVGPNIALQDCLSAFFSEDELDGDNMYSCDKCQKLRNGRKYARLLRLPEVLCIHLKRFRHDFVYSSKISTSVSFPLEGLDVSPYLARTAQASGSTVYDLVAVVVHSGTAGGGHYVAYAQNRLSGKWYEYDDETVTEVNSQVVESVEAYVLFYSKRQSTEISHQRKQQTQLANCMISDANKSLMRFYISTAWLAKFDTFSYPGPISNDDFLCRHGAVRPDKETALEHLVKEVSEVEWNFYHRNFGGGPVATHLHICATCKDRELRLQRRQTREWMAMMKLNNEFQKSPSLNIYAINRRWFLSWERFARGKIREPPGPIDNSSIVYVRNGQLVLRQSSGYGHISEDMWRFLHRRYGGGPVMISINQRPQLSRHASPSPTTPPSRCTPERVSAERLRKAEEEEEREEAAQEDGVAEGSTDNDEKPCERSTASSNEHSASQSSISS